MAKVFAITTVTDKLKADNGKRNDCFHGYQHDFAPAARYR